MYHLIKIKISKKTGENSSRYEEKLFKIRNFGEMKEIDYGEWNELKALGVSELSKGDIENLVDLLKPINVIEKQMTKNLSKF